MELLKGVVNHKRLRNTDLGQLHLLAILNSYRLKLKLVIEHKKTQNIINNVTGNNNCVASFARNVYKKNKKKTHAHKKKLTFAWLKNWII